MRRTRIAAISCLSVDGTVVWMVNEGISIGGVGMMDHTSDGTITIVRDYNANPKNEVTTEYSALQTAP